MTMKMANKVGISNEICPKQVFDIPRSAFCCILEGANLLKVIFYVQEGIQMFL